MPTPLPQGSVAARPAPRRTPFSSIRSCLALGGVLAASSSFSGCRQSPAALSAETKPKAYPVTAPVIMDVPEHREFVADVQALRHVEIKARVGGLVERVLVEEGQFVAAQQTLFVLGARQAHLDMQRADARRLVAASEVRMARIELSGRRELVERQVVSAREVEVAEAALAAAEARLAEAQAEVAAAELARDFAEIKAPFAGQINRLPFKAGSLVAQGDLLTTLSDTAEVLAYFRVAERSALATRRDGENGEPSRVTLLLADGSEHPVAGRIDAIESVVNRSTGSVTHRARFSNPSGSLRHGSTGKVRLTYLRDDAMVIPQRATFERQQDLCVYVVAANGKLAARRIVPALRLANHYVVDRGLDTADRLLLEGAKTVREGATIEPVFRPMAEVAPL